MRVDHSGVYWYDFHPAGQLSSVNSSASAAFFSVALFTSSAQACEQGPSRLAFHDERAATTGRPCGRSGTAFPSRNHGRVSAFLPFFSGGVAARLRGIPSSFQYATSRILRASVTGKVRATLSLWRRLLDATSRSNLQVASGRTRIPGTCSRTVLRSSTRRVRTSAKYRQCTRLPSTRVPLSMQKYCLCRFLAPFRPRKRDLADWCQHPMVGPSSSRVPLYSTYSHTRRLAFALQAPTRSNRQHLLVSISHRANHRNYTARRLRRACATPLWGGNEYWLCNTCEYITGIMLVYVQGDEERKR